MARHLVAALVQAPVAAFELSCAVEIFGLKRSGLDVDWYDFEVGTVKPGLLAATGGLQILVSNGLALFERADTIIVPAWNPTADPPETLIRTLRQAHERGARLLSICSGAFLLAQAGLLDGKRATTHWMYADDLGRRFPRIRVEPDVLYVDEGNIITAAGSAAGLDMLLYLVRRDHGPRVCNMIARRLVVPPHREGGQAQFVERPVPLSPVSKLARVIDWMREHATDDHRTDDLAEMAAMSPRNFYRRFREATGLAPYDWLIRERVAIAKELLEQGVLTIEQVATAAGFGSAEALRHHFRKSVGRSPVDYRKAFRGDLETSHAA
jgi:AraC family transcriptional regulator, transcriptional activator FtrA